MEISNLCNHREAKQSKASPPGAESSGGESTMLSTNFAQAIRGKQAVKIILFLSAVQELTVLCGDKNDCRKLEGSQKLLHKGFS